MSLQLTISKRSLAILCLSVFILSCFSRNTGEQRSAADEATKNLDAYVWTDSLITKRGHFATAPPPDVVQPTTIDSQQYWEGGVFVLPGTKASVLTENGFLDVVPKPGSVMHDYYEALWPIDMKLDILPLSIRQVRYNRRYNDLPQMSWNTFVVRMDSGVYRDVTLATIPNLNSEYFQNYGVLVAKERRRSFGWADEYNCYLERDRSRHMLPPEIIQMRVQESDSLTFRTNKLPQTPPDYKFLKRSDGQDYIEGFARVESKADTVILRKLGFIIDINSPDLLRPKSEKCTVWVLWHKNHVIDSLPIEIKSIVIAPPSK